VHPGRQPAIGHPPVHLVAALIVILGSVLISVSCGVSSPRDESASQTPLQGGLLRMIQEEPISLDPLVGDSVYESLPVNQIFDTLVEFDPSLNLVPGLAKNWTVSRDGLRYTFELREDVRFHDGHKLTAHDATFTILRNLRPLADVRSLAYSSLLVIEGARAYAAGEREDLPGLRLTDEMTLEIRLEQPYRSFLELLAMDALAVVPEHVVLEIGDEAFGRAPVGTGPFRLAGWDDRRLSLEAYPGYFRGGPHLDGVEIGFLQPDEADFGEARFFRGDLDVIEPSTRNLERLEQDPSVRLHRYQELSLSFLGLNSSQPPLDQRWLRQAIVHAIDRRGMVEEAPSVRREAAGILPPGLHGYSPEFKGLDYRPEEARRLLAEAGHPDGRGLPPILLSNPSLGPAAQRVLERVGADLEAVGLRLEIVPVTWSELGEQLEQGTAPAFLLAWVADRTDPDAFLRALFESGGSANYFVYRSEAVDELLDRGAREMNPQTQARIYRELERHILADAPIMPLYHTRGVIALREQVRGLEPTPLGIAKAELEDVWLDDSGGAL
jgi:ABC-type transport system substrate-binding protein